jgi:hypothetical protein
MEDVRFLCFEPNCIRVSNAYSVSAGLSNCQTGQRHPAAADTSTSGVAWAVEPEIFLCRRALPRSDQRGKRLRPILVARHAHEAAILFDRHSSWTGVLVGIQ